MPLNRGVKIANSLAPPVQLQVSISIDVTVRYIVPAGDHKLHGDAPM